MTIFAFPPDTLEHKVRIKEPLSDDDILAYSSADGTFINKKPADVLSTSVVVSAENVGSHNTVSIVADASSGTISFRGLYGGQGINIRVDGNDIIFEVNRHEGNISDTSYSLIFDADGDENNAVFTIETAISSLPYTLNISSFPSLLYDASFHNTTSASYIYIDGLPLSSSVFESSMWIQIYGSDSQDGFYKIISVSAYASGVRMFVDSAFSASSTLSSLQSNIVFSHVPVIAESNGSLPVPPYVSSKFYTLHIWKPISLSEFYAGRTIKIDNSQNSIIDGFYIINQVLTANSTYFDNKGSVLILDYRSPLPDLSASPYYIKTSSTGNFRITATGNIVSTGFIVEKDGTVKAKKIIVSSLPSTDYELANRLYVREEISALRVTDLSSIRNDISALSERVTVVERKINKARAFWAINSNF